MLEYRIYVGGKHIGNTRNSNEFIDIAKRNGYDEEIIYEEMEPSYRDARISSIYLEDENDELPIIEMIEDGEEYES